MLSYYSFKPNHTIDPDFQDDIAALFLETRHGHMEKWEYAAPLYEGDPAAGIVFWTELIKKPGNYYLIEGDTHNVQQSLKDQAFANKLQHIQHLIELGPGCAKSLLQKTLPLIKASPNLTSYQAIDGTYDVAMGAAKFIQKHAGLVPLAESQDFIQKRIKKAKHGPTALVLWGGSIGNFSGNASESAFPKLVKQLHNFQHGLDNGDIVIISFDAEQSGDKVKEAYSEENLRKQITSILFRARRDGILSKGFNPYMWENEPVWVPETGQCCHTIYPVIDQRFHVAGIEVFVPEGKRFISNNSYKYKPNMMTAAATMAGFTYISIMQHGSMALLVAGK